MHESSLRDRTSNLGEGGLSLKQSDVAWHDTPTSAVGIQHAVLIELSEENHYLGSQSTTDNP